MSKREQRGGRSIKPLPKRSQPLQDNWPKTKRRRPHLIPFHRTVRTPIAPSSPPTIPCPHADFHHRRRYAEHISRPLCSIATRLQLSPTRETAPARFRDCAARFPRLRARTQDFNDNLCPRRTLSRLLVAVLYCYCSGARRLRSGYRTIPRTPVLHRITLLF